MSAQRLLPERIEGRHVLFALFGFFGLMLVANGVFLYYALGTFNGFEVKDAYSRGLSYNARIASDSEQAARGWQFDTSYDAQAGMIAANIKDAQGRAVAGLSVTSEFRRPATDREDRTITLKEVHPGRYAAEVRLAPGQWIFIGEARRGALEEVPVYRFKQRLLVRQGR